MPKLKDHILLQIQEMLHQEASQSNVDGNLPQLGLSMIQGHDAGHGLVLFNNDHMYHHNLARFTTYDVRRSQDVINPGTSHC